MGKQRKSNNSSIFVYIIFDLIDQLQWSRGTRVPGHHNENYQPRCLATLPCEALRKWVWKPNQHLTFSHYTAVCSPHPVWTSFYFFHGPQSGNQKDFVLWKVKAHINKPTCMHTEVLIIHRGCTHPNWFVTLKSTLEALLGCGNSGDRFE
jgi:hypothetical protein